MRFRATMDRHGLTMPSGHFTVSQLETDFETSAATARTLGVTTMVCPFLPPADRPSRAAGWAAFAARLEALARTCAAAGFDLAWHNHDFEFATLDEGRTILSVLLDEAPSLGWEMDAAWVVRAGADPIHWIDAYSPRIVAVHVKDIAAQGEKADEDGWADVGHGIMDWRRLLEAYRERTATRLFVVEHDNPRGLERFAHRSMQFLTAN